MMARLRWSWVLLATVFLAALVACGGDDDAGEDDADSTPGETATASGDGGTEGAIEGPLVFVSGAGLYAVDPATGGGRRIEPSDVEGISIGTPPAVAGSAAYVLTFTTVEGQQNSHDGFVTRIDRATGEDAVLVEVGRDRESDTAEDLYEFPEIVATDDAVWVVKQRFGDAGREILRVDPVSGELVATIERARADGFATDGGRLYAFTGEGLEALDPATNAFEPLLPAGTRLAEAAAPNLDLSAIFATEDGSALSADDLEFALRAGIDGSSAGKGRGALGGILYSLAYGDGAIWFGWSAVFSTIDGVSYVGQAILRYDLASGLVDGAVPLSGFGEHFLEGNTVSNSIGDIHWHADALWVVSPQSNGAVLRIDPATLEAEVAYEPCGSEFICSDADDVLFNRTDPDRIWIEYTRLVDQGGGSRSGEIFLEQLDSATGARVLEVPFSQIYQ